MDYKKRLMVCQTNATDLSSIENRIEKRRAYPMIKKLLIARIELAIINPIMEIV